MSDNCVGVYNPDQKNTDGLPDGGDACDADNDNDGTPDSLDLYPYQAGIGDGNDFDGDGVPNAIDHCPKVYDPSNKDTDGDGLGDACDPDIDGDGITNEDDNCPTTWNPDQADTDHDGVGDLCDCAPHIVEYPIYGLTREGIARPDTSIYSRFQDTITTRVVGQKAYELTDQLGNVRATISDIKLPTGTPGSGPYKVDFLSYMNPYPFGMPQPGRFWESKVYRYGYNGKERDDEIKGAGESYDYGFRMLDPRVGRFLSVDPLTAEYPWYSPYQFAGNMPTSMVDRDGLEPARPNAVNTQPTETGGDVSAGSGTPPVVDEAAAEQLSRNARTSRQDATATQITETPLRSLSYDGLGAVPAPAPVIRDEKIDAYTPSPGESFVRYLHGPEPQGYWGGVGHRIVGFFGTIPVGILDEIQVAGSGTFGSGPAMHLDRTPASNEEVQWATINLALVVMDPEAIAGKVASTGVDAGRELVAGSGGRMIAADAAERVLNPPINITQRGLEHTLERHTINDLAKFAKKSKFNPGENIVDLISSGTQMRAFQQPNGNFARVFDVGRNIGIDRAINEQTSIMTVITKANGDLVTAFPGKP